MDRYKDKVAVVTGASSGIGAGIAEMLLRNGMKVVGLARRKENIEKICNDDENLKKNLFALKVDVTHEEEIVEAFKWITENVGPLSVLVNSAGTYKLGTVLGGDSQNWRALIDTNLIGAALAAREAIAIIKKHNVPDGYIININSIAGHKVSNLPTFYHASKYGLTALSQSLRIELQHQCNPIRTCNISSGMVDTEMIDHYVALKGLQDKAQFMQENPYLLCEDVADAVKFLLSTRPLVEITELTIRPYGERH